MQQNLSKSSHDPPDGCLELTAQSVMDQKYKKKILLSSNEICTYIWICDHFFATMA